MSPSQRPLLLFGSSSNRPRFVACLRVLLAVGVLLVAPRASSQAALPQPALLPSFNPLCDSNLVPCLDMDDFAAHGYAHLLVLPRTELRDTAAVVPYGVTLGLLGRLAGGISTHYAFWQEGEAPTRRYHGHGPLRLSLSALLWPILPLRQSPQSESHDVETNFVPPRHLRVGLLYEHELRIGPFNGANSLGLLTDLAALRLVATRSFGAIEITASAGALFDWQGRFATGEGAVQLGVYLPFFKALKLYGEALGRGGLASVQDGVADLARAEDPFRRQGVLGLGLSFRPQARVDLGVSAQWGLGGLAPSAVLLRFAVLSVGRTYQGRAATALVDLAAEGAATLGDKIKQYIESLPIDPVLDHRCVILDDDGSVLGSFGKRSTSSTYCEEDGFRVRIGEHFERPRKSKDRLCRDQALTDCVLERRGASWVPVHRPRLDGHCDLYDSDGAYLGRVGEPARDGRSCRQRVQRPNGGYGSSEEYQDRPIGEFFYTDSDRSKVCIDPALRRCFVEAPAGRKTLAVERLERFAKRYDQRLSQDAEQAHDKAARILGGQVSLTTVREEAEQAARKLAETVQDPAKLKEAALSRVSALGQAVERFKNQSPEQQLDTMAHAAAEATESAVGAAAAALVPGGRVLTEAVDEAADAAKAARAGAQAGRVAQAGQRVQKAEAAALNGAAAPKGPYLVTPSGSVLPPNRDYNLVPTKPGGSWLQIHGQHAHGDLGRPHTHHPEVHRSAVTGRGRTDRIARPTTSEDIDRADAALRSGELRHRTNYNDRGGTP